MKRVLITLLVIAALPSFAAIESQTTIPVVGQVFLPGHKYTTELTITNHRDAEQLIAVEFIAGRGPDYVTTTLLMAPKETRFMHGPVVSNFMGIGPEHQGIGALRFTAVVPDAFSDDTFDVERFRDREGRVEVKAFIINERGPLGLYGASRQEIEGIPASETTAKENVFVGVLHQPPTYTNVGIVNLHPTETVTFFVKYQYLEPVAVTVPPYSSRQIRVVGGRAPGEEGNAGRYVIVSPEWANDGSGRTTPWVAYSSTIDGLTGDAFSGVRVPPETAIRR